MAGKRRIVMFNRVTPDGYFAGAGGNLDWFVHDAEIDKKAMEKDSPQVDTFLLGRRTYDLFASYWPHALDEGARGPHGMEALSKEQREMAVGLNEMTKLVFSRTLKDATWKNSRIVRDLDPQAIAAMKQQPGKDMLVLGSGSIVSQLTQHGLIDEYQIVVSPVFLGSGQPLISGLSKSVSVRLTETIPYKTGNVMLRYVRDQG